METKKQIKYMKHMDKLNSEILSILDLMLKEKSKLIKVQNREIEGDVKKIEAFISILQNRLDTLGLEQLAIKTKLKNNKI